MKIRDFCKECPCYDFEPESRTLRPNYSAHLCVVGHHAYTIAKEYHPKQLHPRLHDKNKMKTLENGNLLEEIGINPKCPIILFLTKWLEE